jgi:hypothetical protein
MPLDETQLENAKVNIAVVESMAVGVKVTSVAAQRMVVVAARAVVKWAVP